MEVADPVGSENDALQSDCHWYVYGGVPLVTVTEACTVDPGRGVGRDRGLHVEAFLHSGQDEEVQERSYGVAVGVGVFLNSCPASYMTMPLP